MGGEKSCSDVRRGHNLEGGASAAAQSPGQKGSIDVHSDSDQNRPNSRCLVFGPSVFVLTNVLCCFILMGIQLSNPITQSGTEET